MGQSGWRVLGNIRDLHAKAFAITHRLSYLRASVADDNPNLVDARISNRFDDAEQYGLISDWNELLGSGIGQWVKACALTATQNQSSHVTSLLLCAVVLVHAAILKCIAQGYTDDTDTGTIQDFFSLLGM